MKRQRYTVHHPDGQIEEGILLGVHPFTPELYRAVDQLNAKRGADYTIWHNFLKGPEDVQ